MAPRPAIEKLITLAKKAYLAEDNVHKNYIIEGFVMKPELGDKKAVEEVV